MRSLAVLLIATGKYDSFVQPLLKSMEDLFFTDRPVTIHLFTDGFIGTSSNRITVKRYVIPSYKFPQASLYRYKIFHEHKDYLTEDLLLYLDVDTLIKNPVGEEIFGSGVTAVYHPGFYVNHGWGSPNCDQRSTSYVQPSQRIYYYCGGTQGGTRESYLEACRILSENISIDETNGITPEWHDETAWNHYLNTVYVGEIRAMDPSYCMPENPKQRQKWGLETIPSRICCLDKSHDSIRL